MATTYPNETLNWSSQSGYLTDTTKYDTGQTVISVQTNHSNGQDYANNTYMAPTTGGQTQTGLPTGTKTLMSQAGMGYTASSTFTFGDDPTASGTVNTAEQLTFKIYGIDKTSNYTDVITIKALDGNGDPVPVSASTADNFNVTYNADGSVTLTGKQAFVSPNTAASTSIIIFDGPVDKLTITHTGSGGSSQVYIGNFSYIPSTALCFAAGTMILTDRGEIAVEDLSPGDMVITRDHGPQPLRWVGAQVFDLTWPAAERLRPVRIRAGALGQGLPHADLVVSPQHRVLVRSAIAQKMFGAPEVLVAAKQLLQVEGIDLAEDLDAITYVHFLFDRHQVVFSNGAETESLFTGPEALKTVGRAARDEILAIFPQLAEGGADLPPPARDLASGRMGRKLAVRHAQNAKPLVS